MQMKHLLVALIVLLAIAGTASAATSVDIRSTIIDSTVAGPWTINAMNWAGLYYDLDDNQSTETITITSVGAANPATKLNITYETEPKMIGYEFGNWSYGGSPAKYAIIGFFAEPYVALGKENTTAVGDVKANKIAKLLMDSNDKYTLTTGQALDLGDGYSLVANQIDVNGNKVYLELFKDGKSIDTSIQNSNYTDANNRTWVLTQDVLGEKDMQFFRVQVSQVFQGTSSSLVEIKGIWLVDIASAFEVKTDVDYGKFECQQADATKLEYFAKEIPVGQNTSTELGRGIYLKTPDKTGTTKFYLVKTYTEPGKYEIRSTVNSYGAAATFNYDYKNFATFYYNVNADIDTENMSVAFAGTDGKIAEGDLIYNTTPKKVGYEYGNWTFNGQGGVDEYYVMGLFGEAYVPFNINTTVNSSSTPILKAEKMSKLILDSNDKYTLSTGQTLDLGNGYTVVPNQIDVNGNKVYLEFFKDGKSVDTAIINTDNNSDNQKTWVLEQNLLGEKNVQVMRVHVSQVFQGTESSLVEIKGIWLMDYTAAKELKTDDKFGSFDFTGFTGGKLEFESNKNITVAQDSDIQIANNMYLKSADNATEKNFYFYVMAEVDGSGPTPDNNTTPVQPDNNTTPVQPDNNTTPVQPDNNSTPPTPEKPSFWDQYMWYIIGAVVIIIILAAGGYYYFKVYKPKNS
ncbi:hypothetical protein MsAc7_08200 [Methanolapillus millepedarum]|uniref:S-layer family duplication domain-containing protein n=2 Tax=Methanolapillus millepedarum TaxID=3028296 RepID=A0AA96V2L3_9EURY|nr:hypothetical protein MsAc7_08200 [Methanosarcinaceae archaeon Ac7]